jgi:hypothetical protein
MLRFGNLSEGARDWLMVIPAGVLFFGFNAFLQREKAFLIALSFGAFYIVISREWDKRGQQWFWAVLALFALIHIVALSLIALPHFTGPSLAIAVPFMGVDTFGMWGIVRLVEKRISRSAAA